MEIEEQKEIHDPEKPATLGRFEVIKELGEGYTSNIMLGFDPQADKSVALKVLKSTYI